MTLGALLGLMGALLGGGELWARQAITDRELLLVHDMPFLQDDPWLLWRLRPGFSAPIWQGEPLTINSIGLRDGELREAPAGTARILSLGESSTWGHGVDARDTYTEQAGALLTASGRPADAINAGVPAWSLYQSALFLEREGAAFAPSAVLVYHLQNDLMSRGGGANRRDPFQVSMSDRQLMEARRPLAPLMELLAGSRLRQWIWLRWLAPRMAQPGERVSGAVPRVPEADRRAALDRILAWCDAANAVMIVMKPVYARGKFMEDRVMERWAAEQHTYRVFYLDLPRLKAAAQVPDAGFFQIDDTHPTPAGHRWIAEQVAVALSQKPVTP